MSGLLGSLQDELTFDWVGNEARPAAATTVRWLLPLAPGLQPQHRYIFAA